MIGVDDVGGETLVNVILALLQGELRRGGKVCCPNPGCQESGRLGSWLGAGRLRVLVLSCMSFIWLDNCRITSVCA